jgi:hypothetical protein
MSLPPALGQNRILFRFSETVAIKNGASQKPRMRWV